MKRFPERALAFGGICILCLLLIAVNPGNDFAISPDTPVMQVLALLGDKTPPHYRPHIDSIKIKQGRDLVYQGFTSSAKGNKTKPISIHFTCTDCHNTVIEDPVLHNPSPENRLSYARSENLPFLQGTTLYGVVNRESWYNDDYQWKYGQWAQKASNNLEEAIQLCAKECSKGRLLEEWEMEAILAYFSTIDLKLEDVGFQEEEIANLKELLDLIPPHEALSRLKGLYAQKSRAHFLSADEARKATELLEGDSLNGKYVYEHGCQHCHASSRVTDLLLDDQQLTFKFLKKHFDKNSKKSVFHAVREGVPGTTGYPPYMPEYTVERMSSQQLADLVAFIEWKAKGSKP